MGRIVDAGSALGLGALLPHPWLYPGATELLSGGLWDRPEKRGLEKLNGDRYGKVQGVKQPWTFIWTVGSRGR